VVASAAILSQFLPVCLANVPFSRSETWQSHVVSTWVSVGVMSYMIIISVSLFYFYIVTLRQLRRKFSCDLTIVMQGPKTMADVISLVSGSNILLQRLSGLSLLSTRSQKLKLEEMKLKYYITEVAAQNGTKLRLEVTAPESI